MRRSVLAVVAAAFLVSLAPIDAQDSARGRAVRLFGHRGFTRDAPENSLAALAAAVKLGLAGSEVDLRTTRDGHVVLMHDTSVERTTDGSGSVAALTWAQIRSFRVERIDGTATAETVPDLAAVLGFMQQHPRFEIAFDAKSIDIASVGRRVLDAGVQERVHFFIDDPLQVERAQAVKRIDPRLRISVNLLGWWKIEGLPTFVRRSLGADALFASEFFFPRAGFAEAREAGAEVQVYLYGEDALEARFRRAVALGADLVSSDRPDRLVPLLQEGRYTATAAPR